MILVDNSHIIVDGIGIDLLSEYAILTKSLVKRGIPKVALQKAMETGVMTDEEIRKEITEKLKDPEKLAGALFAATSIYGPEKVAEFLNKKFEEGEKK